MTSTTAGAPQPTGTAARWTSSSPGTSPPTGPKNGPLAMGYYTRADLPFYYALADALHALRPLPLLGAWADRPEPLLHDVGVDRPERHRRGGPIISTLGSTRLQTYGKFTWTTMPEILQEAGISWKVYESPENLSPVSDNVLPYFKRVSEQPAAGCERVRQHLPGAVHRRLRGGHAAAGLAGGRAGRDLQASTGPDHLGRSGDRAGAERDDVQPGCLGAERTAGRHMTRTAASSITCRRRRRPRPRPGST